MLKKENIDNFINYNFIPFSKKQCVKEMVVIWLLSALLCVIRKPFLMWAILFGILCLAVTIFFTIVLLKFSKYKISRFLNDGIVCSYIAIILNFTAYRIISVVIGQSWILAIVFFSLLLLSASLSFVATIYNIKSNKFSATSNAKVNIVFPLVGSALGILTARIMLRGQENESHVAFLAAIVLFFSFLISIIPPANFLGVWLLSKKTD